MWPTVEETTAYFGIDYSSLTPQEQATWTSQRLAVISAIEEYCSRKFEVNTYTDKLRVDMKDEKILLQNYPIDSITSITKADSSVIDSAKYYPINSIGEVVYVSESNNPCPWPFGSYEVEYSAGFAILPDLLLSTYHDLSLYMFNMVSSILSSSAGLVKKSVIFGVSSIEFDNTIYNDSDKNEWGNYFKNYSDVLDKYRSEKSFNLIYNTDF